MESRSFAQLEGSVLSPELDPCKLYSLRAVFDIVETDLLIETLCLSGEYSAAVYDWKELIDALQSNSKHARLRPLRRILRFSQVLLQLRNKSPRPLTRRSRAKRGAAGSRRYLLVEALVLSEQMCRDQAVTRVSLDENRLDQDISQLEELSLMVAKTTTLRRLDLAFNRLSNIETLATALNKSNRTLTTLNLGFNRLGDAGAALIAFVIRDNDVLRNVNLRGNCINDAGYSSLAKVLNTNRGLVTLNLSFNNSMIRPTTAAGWAKALSCNCVLIEVNFSSTPMSNEAYRLLYQFAVSGPFAWIFGTNLILRSAATQAATT